MAEKIKIGKMSVEPVFTVAAWMDIEERFGALGAAVDAMKEDGKWIEATAAMTAILCNQGLRKLGKKPALTQENVLNLMLTMKSAQMLKARNLCLAAIVEGSRTETEEDDDEEPVDVVLEELQKKTDAPSEPPGA